MKSTLLTAAAVALCFAAALAPRLYLLADQTIQADERHWESRSQEFLRNIQRGAYSVATSHFSQPGLVPGVLMAGGQAAARCYNKKSGYEWGDEAYIDRLHAGRMTNAVASSFTAPAAFLGARFFIGTAPALLGALLLALDPQFTSISRLAHIDAVLTLLVTVAFLLFMHSESRGSLRLKLTAGAIWGLAIATKPTAASLVFALLIYKALDALGLFERRKPSWRILSWGDVGAVLTGHVVFCAIYTRFWRTNSTYVWRLHIQSSLADFFYNAGTALSQHTWWIVLFAWTALVGAHLAWTAGPRAARRHSGLALALAAALAALWPLMPAVFENLTRYWSWAAGLSREVHSAYGRTWTPPAWGYWGVMLHHLPSLALAGVAAGTVILARELGTRRASPGSRFAFSCLLLAVIWTAILGVSAKQTIRYIIPVWPAVYLTAAWGLVGLWRRLAPLAGRRAERWSPVAAVAVIATQALQTFSLAPNYELYYNAISGGLDRAVYRGDLLPAIGQEQALRFLQRRAEEAGADLYVMVLGDASVVEKTYKRSFPKHHKRLHFVAYGQMERGDYVLVTPAFKGSLSPEQRELLQPVFKHELFGHSFVEVMAVPFFPYDTEHKIDLAAAPRQSGAIELRGDPPREAVVALPGRDLKGLLLFGVHVRPQAGHYRVHFRAGAPGESGFDPTVRPQEPAVKIELSSACSRVIRRGELAHGQFKDFTFDCQVDRSARLQFRIYWWAKTPLMFPSPTFVAGD